MNSLIEWNSQKRSIKYIFLLIAFFYSHEFITAQNKIIVSSISFIPAANGTYNQIGTLNSRPYYELGNYRVAYDNKGGAGLEWELYEISPVVSRYYNLSSANTPPYSGWLLDIASGSVPNVSASIDFTDGSAFSPSNGTPGTNNNPLGRFFLDAGSDAASVTALTIQLSGTRSGISAVKLWSSTDNSFNSGSDTQLNSQSDGSSVSFSSFSSAVSYSGTYYFVTVDLTAGASGSVTATISNNASFTISQGSIATSISSAALSSSSVPLPVELVTFAASIIDNSVLLNWITVTEVNNYGFNVERSIKDEEWMGLGFIEGSGNSNSQKNYSFEDRNVTTGTYRYRLKQIDIDGSFEYSQVIDVSVELPGRFELNQNYPNPFNPTTIISYQLSAASNAKLTVYDVLGSSVATIVNEQQEPGNHKVNFNAAEYNLPAGIYFYKLTADNLSATKKFILLK